MASASETIMAQTIMIGPVTRIEGHLDIEVTVDLVDGKQQVVDAKCSGTMFRGFENILVGRDPLDALHYTQRICGVCPISHGMASSLALDDALQSPDFALPDNGRIVRNLVLGSNFIQSHILHFYHLASLDFVKTAGLLDMSPWSAQFTSPDMVAGDTAARLVDHYVQALAIRRKAHQMGSIFGGKLPCSPVFVPGGATKVATPEDVSAFSTLLAEICCFIETVYVPDVLLLAEKFPEYAGIGRGWGNLLAFGVFDQDAAGTTKLLARGRYTDGTNLDSGGVDANQIKEYVARAWYSSASGLNPASGATTPSKSKAGAYTWVKAPRYLDKPHEVGPLARMWAGGEYRKGISVLDRHAARALETRKIAGAMATWVAQLDLAKPFYSYRPLVGSRSGIGMTEAARGALGHWVAIDRNKKIASYQVVTPTAWNASPTDDMGQKGPIEKALVGTAVRDLASPVEVLRVVHSFDPCLACSVHAARPGAPARKFVAAQP
jgi:hydrogenase large subunit